MSTKPTSDIPSGKRAKADPAKASSGLLPLDQAIQPPSSSDSSNWDLFFKSLQEDGEAVLREIQRIRLHSSISTKAAEALRAALSKTAEAFGSALLQAVNGDDATAVKTLLVGADINTLDRNGRAAITLAASNGRNEVGQLILEFATNSTPNGKRKKVNFEKLSNNFLKLKDLLDDVDAYGIYTICSILEKDFWDEPICMKDINNRIEMILRNEFPNAEIRKELVGRLASIIASEREVNPEVADSQLDTSAQTSEYSLASDELTKNIIKTPAGSLTEKQIVEVMHDSTLGKLQKRYDRLRDFTLPSGALQTEEDIKALNLLNNTYTRLQDRRRKLGIPPLPTDERVTEARRILKAASRGRKMGSKQNLG